MQYIYTEFDLPSNGKLYPINKVHLRPKTIFDIKMLLNNPVFMLKSEIDALQKCINPEDNVNVYDLANKDVVYLLYMLRSLSNNNLSISYKGKTFNSTISELNIKYLEEYNPERKLPSSGKIVNLAPVTIGHIFNLEQEKQKFLSKYPDYTGDVANTVSLLNAIASVDGSTNKDMIRAQLEQLDWTDSIYLIEQIEENSNLDFGIEEFVDVTDEEGRKIKLPIQINENFFRATL